MTSSAAERAAAARALWTTGDYEVVGSRWAQAAVDVVASLDVAGKDVLDVGTGTGEAALAAARMGAARVVGCDPTPELLAVAARRATEEGLTVGWEEGDAQDLPFDDEAFDVVVSTFGAMFAPDPEAAAAELLRVTRRGGRVVSTAWTPESPWRRMASQGAALLGAPAGEKAPQERWAEPDLVAEIFAGLPVDLRCDVAVVDVRGESAEELLATLEEHSAPIIGARAQLTKTGQWAGLRSAWLDLLSQVGRSEDDGFVLPVPYLVVTAVRR